MKTFLGEKRIVRSKRKHYTKDFMGALKGERKSTTLPEEYNYFGELIGSWQIHYIKGDNDHVIRGEWHFSWVPEGMAIQDVITLLDYEYETSLRIFNPDTHMWDVAYGYTGKIIQLVARKQGEMIVLTFTSDEKRKWVFVEIGDNQFHRQNITVKDDDE